MEILIPLACIFGVMCFVYMVMRNGCGAPEKRNAVDYIAMVGMWLCPVTWAIYIIVMPAALLVDHFNAKEADAHRKDFNATK